MPQSTAPQTEDNALEVERIDAGQLLRRTSNEINAELTPGLIHEVNNVLTGIYFNLESCHEFFEEDHPIAQTLREINAGVERIKDILGRTAQIHLNVAERERSYHDLEALVFSQLDLLRIVFPKTASVTLTPPRVPLHVHVAEYPFRVTLLTIAARLRQLFPSGKVEIPLEIFTPEQVAEAIRRTGGEVILDAVAVAFKLPCFTESVGEIDDYLVAVSESDISMVHAGVLASQLGGRLLVCSSAGGRTSEVLLVLPRFDLAA
jgi:hypothetical protein